MTEREATVNRDLRALDDAHRLGQIGRAEYRARRRNVLASLASTEAATERNPVQALDGGEGHSAAKNTAASGKASVTPARLPPALPPAAQPGKPGLPLPAILLALFALLVLVVAVWFLFLRPTAERPTAAAAVPTAEVAATDPANAFEISAQQVIANERWDVASADSLAGNWNALDAAARAGLRGKPVYEQLRQQLQRRRKVVDLLLEGAAADDPKRNEAAALKALDAALAGS